MPTNVFYANSSVVSIWTNPDNLSGDNTPLNNHLNNLDRIKFDSRLDYLNIVGVQNFTISLGFVDINRVNSGKKGKDSSLIPIEGSSITNIATHNFGYVPGGILVDRDTNQALAGNFFITNNDNTSFRMLYLLADSNYFYIKDKYFVRISPLQAQTKSFTLYILNNPSTI